MELVVLRFFFSIACCFALGRLIKAEEWAVKPHTENQKFREDEVTLTFGDVRLVMRQKWDELDVAGIVWPAGEVLCEYLEANPAVVSGKKVLELGAGTGVVGMLAAKLGSDVTSTDKRQVLSLTQENVELNFSPSENRPAVKQLEWGADNEAFASDAFDVVLGSDIVYFEDDFGDLIKTLRYFSRKHADRTPVIYLSSKIRYERDSLFNRKLEKYFSLEEVVFDKERNIHVYRAVGKSLWEE